MKRSDIYLMIAASLLAVATSIKALAMLELLIQLLVKS